MPSATRANFCVAKFSSFVAFEQLKTPVMRAVVERLAEAGRGAVERLVPACGPQLSVLTHERRRQPLVLHRHALESRARDGA